MTRLYDIANEYQTTLDALADEETGEINEQALESLNALSTDLKEKGIAIASFIRNIDADREPSLAAARAFQRRLLPHFSCEFMQLISNNCFSSFQFDLRKGFGRYPRLNFRNTFVSQKS